MDKSLKPELSSKLGNKTNTPITIFTLIRHSLFSMRRGNTVLLVALVGVSVGLCSLISITGTMNGMQSILIDNLISIESYDYQGTSPPETRIENIEELEASPNIALVMPFIDEFAFLESRDVSFIAHLRALDSYQVNKDVQFLRSLSLNSSGDYRYLEKNARYTADTSGDTSNDALDSISDRSATDTETQVKASPVQTDYPPLMIGWDIAGKLGVRKGDVISVLLPGAGKGFVPQKTLMRISDVFYSQSEYDKRWAFMALDDYLNLVPNTSKINYGIRAASHKRIRPTLNTRLQEVNSWKENNNTFYIALKSEKTILILLSAVIFLIIILHFRFAMMRRINNKKDDIVALRTMGANSSQISGWFLGETIAVGIMGTILGLTTGLGFVFGYPYIEHWVAYNIGFVFNVGNVIGGNISMKEIIFLVCFTWIAILWSTWSVIQRSTKITPMQVLRYE